MNITNYLSVNIIIKIYEHLHKIYSAKNFVSLEDLYESLDFVAGGRFSDFFLPIRLLHFVSTNRLTNVYLFIVSISLFTIE